MNTTSTQIQWIAPHVRDLFAPFLPFPYVWLHDSATHDVYYIVIPRHFSTRQHDFLLSCLITNWQANKGLLLDSIFYCKMDIYKIILFCHHSSIGGPPTPTCSGFCVAATLSDQRDSLWLFGGGWLLAAQNTCLANQALRGRWHTAGLIGLWP